MKPLYIRDDDILVSSREFAGREFDRFRGKHELICQVPGKLMHAPAILVSEIQEFPQCINYLKEETNAGRMDPQLHGYKHIDYAKLSISEINEHLEKSLEWFNITFGLLPSKWYTPFGAGADSNGFFLNEIASNFNLTLYAVDTGRNEITSVKASKELTHAMRDLRDGMTFSRFASDNEDVLFHWWNRGSRLERLVEVAKYDTWEDAAIFNKKLFK